MSTAWYAQQRTYYARRIKKTNPFFPENRVILLERDERHATQGNPQGVLLVSEGRTFRAYPTAAVKRLVGISIEEVAETGAPGNTNHIASNRAAHEPAPDAVASILEDEGLVQLLEREGIDTVPVLLEHWVSGRLDGIRGIGEARKARVRSALFEAGLIKVDVEDGG